MDLAKVQAIVHRTNPGACPLCTPLEGTAWPIDQPPLEMAGAIHPHCLCYYDWVEELPPGTLGIDEWESTRREWAGRWLKDHPPVTERHFRWTDSLSRVASYDPVMYADDLAGDLLANDTYMMGYLYMSGAILAPQEKEERPPGTTVEEWGYE